jgi:hypothetical protein
LKKAFWKLERLGGDNNVETLDHGAKRRLDLSSGIPFNCQIALAGMKPPIIIMFKGLKATPEHITMYGSFKNKSPSSQSNDCFHVGNIPSIKVYPNDNTRAKNFGTYENFYMMLESDSSAL